MARRNRSHEEEENLERWLVSYADFVTLLFAFFVVMYAISSVNEGKYRVLSESLDAVFNETLRSNEPIQVGELARQTKVDPIPFQDPTQDVGKNAEPTSNPAADLDELENMLAVSLGHYLDKDLVEMVRLDDRIEVRIKDRMLFGSGNAALGRDALPVLQDLAKVLRSQAHGIEVEGHTDDIPISTAQFPSNWELSAARAASVVHFLSRLGVSPGRMAAIGYGEFRPLDENLTAEGRSRNRRVSIMLTPPEQAIDRSMEHLIEPLPWAEGPALEAQ